MATNIIAHLPHIPNKDYRWFRPTIYSRQSFNPPWVERRQETKKLSFINDTNLLEIQGTLAPAQEPHR